MTGPIRAVRRRLVDVLGGPRRARIVLTLASVLALDTADKAAVGATATNLEHAFAIGKTELGLLITVSSVVAAVASLPFGTLVDRVERTRLLSVVVVLWSASMLATAAAPSFLWLLVSRAALGLLAAAAYPAVSSLIGDAFPSADRAAVLGRVLAGELVGTGLGIFLAGTVASVSTWRLSFVVLALPAAAVAWAVRRLDEPERGAGEPGDDPEQATASEPAAPAAAAGRSRQRDDEAPRGDVSLWRAMRYVLGIRTNVVLIVSSALGYYLFAGIRAFGVEFADRHYGISQALASSLVFAVGAGGLAGVALGGVASDRALAKGRSDVRIVIPALGLAGAGVLFAPAVISRSALVAVPLLAAATLFVGVSYPSLEAARLDVVPPRLWGRAEAARTIVRMGLEGMAPVVFGSVAQHAFGGESGSGLEKTFLVMLVPLFASCVVLLLARRSYLDDRTAASAEARRGRRPKETVST